jgi:hypothetical protein
MKLFIGFIQWAATASFLLVVMRALTTVSGVSSGIPLVRWINVITSVLLAFTIAYKMWFGPFRDDFLKDLDDWSNRLNSTKGKKK